MVLRYIYCHCSVPRSSSHIGHRSIAGRCARVGWKCMTKFGRGTCKAARCNVSASCLKRWIVSCERWRSVFRAASFQQGGGMRRETNKQLSGSTFPPPPLIALHDLHNLAILYRIMLFTYRNLSRYPPKIFAGTQTGTKMSSFQNLTNSSF